MSKPKVMLVDDEVRLLSTTKRLLERQGVEVLTAAGGKEALALLSDHEVDLVFLDVKMPGMDGLEVLPRIKKAYPGVDVYLLTGHSSIEDAIEGIQRGASDYILKPVSVNEIMDIINESANGIKHEKSCNSLINS